MLSFLNRESETMKLTAALRGGTGIPVFVVVYGRRRCGKSRLLQKLMIEKDIYHLAENKDKILQIRSLSDEIAGTVKEFNSVTYPDWESVLKNYNIRATKGTSLVIDEFPYLVHQSPELPSVLQKFLDTHKDRNFNMIICGSSQRMMHGLVMDASSPLYGRADEIIKIRPMDCKWISMALSLNPVESVEAYSILGGVPRYWELALGKNLESIIRDIIIDRDAILYEEPVRLLLDDMQTVVQSYSLLSVVGNGANRISEIASRLGKPAGSLTRLLSQIVNLGYIRREVPYGESIKTTKRSLYKIEDPFMSLYFKFVEPFKSQIELGLSDDLYSNIIKPRLSGHISEVWEELARKSVPALGLFDKKWKPACRWWGYGKDGNQMEVDVVSETYDGKSLLLGEAKWSENVSVNEVNKRMEYIEDNFPLIKNMTVNRVLFLKRKCAGMNAHIIDPGDIVGNVL
jgi:hypothetical protein